MDGQITLCRAIRIGGDYFRRPFEQLRVDLVAPDRCQPGFGRLAIRLWNRYDDYAFVNKLREKFTTYCNSQGRDQVVYDWLMLKSDRMQRDMGDIGKYEYKPPFMNHYIKDYPIILNMLPNLRRHIQQYSGGSLNGNEINDEMDTIDEALLRYKGVTKEQLHGLWKQLLNPFLWLALVFGIPGSNGGVAALRRSAGRWWRRCTARQKLARERSRSLPD